MDGTQTDQANYKAPVEPDKKQNEVINAAVDEFLLVEAGPGTGKTEVAAMRLVGLLSKGVNPSQILVLSFSRSAVSTLTRRLKNLDLKDEHILENLRHLSIRTFDSWAFRMLRQLGRPASELLIKTHDDNISALANALKDGSVPLSDRLSGIKHLIVDEFQDLPGVRAELVKALISRLNKDPKKTVGYTVLGDPAQTIYRFAARNNGYVISDNPWSEIELQLSKKPRKIKLTKNYRSSDDLAGLTRRLREILDNSELTAEHKLSEVAAFIESLPADLPDEKLSSEWLSELPQGTFAILTRTNGEALQVWKMLMGKSVQSPSVSIRLKVTGEASNPPAWIAGLLSEYKHSSLTRKVYEFAYRRLLESIVDSSLIELPEIETGWVRLARASGLSETATEVDLDELRRRLDWPDSFPDERYGNNQLSIYVTTVHQAKGMEFDNVAILQHPTQESGETCDDPIEEASVGFVAVTRAGKRLSRIPPSSIYRPYSLMQFANRSRQMSWGRMTSLQAGLPGDIEPISFVDAGLHGNRDAVEDLQHALLRNVKSWQGYKVYLKKTYSVNGSTRARHIRYEIRLQSPDAEGLLLGRTSWQFTQDLLDLLWNRGLSMPNSIYNLRILDICSYSAISMDSNLVPEPYNSSKLWLGVTLQGTGDFKTWKRYGN